MKSKNELNKIQRFKKERKEKKMVDCSRFFTLKCMTFWVCFFISFVAMIFAIVELLLYPCGTTCSTANYLALITFIIGMWLPQPKLKIEHPQGHIQLN